MNNKLMELFKNPTCEYRGAPFWAWNGKMEPEELRRQIRLMHQMGLGGFFMHARIGLNTEFLGKEWFDCIKSCIDEAKKLGMNAWLYDEDRWPSGAGGGLVTVNPQYRSRKIIVKEISDPTELQTFDSTVAVFTACLNEASAANVKRMTNTGPINLAAGEKIIHFYVQIDDASSWFNGQTYLDTLNPEAVRKFIDVAYEAYRKNIASDFAGTVPGIFTDEPYFGGTVMAKIDGSTCKSPWTGTLPEVFKSRYGYELNEHLMELFYDVEGTDSAQVRLNYMDCLTWMFVNAYARQIGEWCGKNNLQFTGHLISEDTLSSQSGHVGACMRSYEYMQAPGMDTLTEHRRIYDTAKQVTSVARQFDRKWRITELYGCTGWDFSFAGHKAIGDWHAALGINLRCQHLFWYTMEGEAKRDYPAAISYQSPWWKEYTKVEDYFARVNAVMTDGEEVRDLLVVHPVESTWIKVRKNWNDNKEVAILDRQFIELRDCIHNAGIDFDYGDEDIMARHGKITRLDGVPVLILGHARYKAVVVPEMLTIRASTIQLLKEFKNAGGTVMIIGKPAAYLEGRPSPIMQTFSAECDHVATYDAELIAQIAPAARNVSFTDGKNKPIHNLLHQLRKTDDHTALFVCNTGYPQDPPPSMNQSLTVRDRNAEFPQVTINVKTAHQGEALELDPGTGAIYRANAERTAAGWKITTSLAVIGSRMFTFNATASNTVYPFNAEYKVISSKAIAPKEWDFIRSEENVLLLEHAVYRIDGGEWHAPEYVLFLDDAVRQHIGLAKRGETMKQPWVINGKISKKSVHLELEYQFDCDVIPSGALYLALEKAELYQISVNGTPISAEMECGWWCDCSLHKLPINPLLLQTGRNRIQLAIDYTEAHAGLENIYLLGEFGVNADGEAAKLIALPRQLQIGDWVPQGLPFYSGNLSYSSKFTAPGLKQERAFISLGEFRGVAASILINGKAAGITAWPPYELDVTDLLQPGENILTIEILNSRRNSHGPFHCSGKYIPWTGPLQFHDYKERLQLVPCGMMQPPQLEIRK